LRTTWEKERAFPASVVNHVRAHLLDAGLHFFKHRKRILFVSPIRPQRHQTGHVFSEGIAAILAIIEATPRITRPQLATKVLGEATDQPDVAAKKAALAADLHYLIRAGHVIEFHDGTLDLPLTPRAEKETGLATAESDGGAQTPAPAPEESSGDSAAPAVGTAGPATTTMTPLPAGAEVAPIANEMSLQAAPGPLPPDPDDIATMVAAPDAVEIDPPLITTSAPADETPRELQNPP
jgi:hypothetical protein